MKCIKSAVLALLLTVVSLTPQMVYAQPAPLQGLNEYVLKAMEEWEIPGIAIAVVKDDKIFFIKGYGIRKLGESERIDEHTLFGIASNSKAFTAATVGILVERGELKWDDKVTDYLKGFQLYDPYVTRELTVRDLLTHRSGLSRGDQLWWRTEYSREEVLHRVRFLKPSWSFRSKYGYQNIMFLAAGEVVAAASGMSWDGFIDRNIFEPLNMKMTHTKIEDLRTFDNVASSHAYIKDEVKWIPDYSVNNIGPAGSINSNAIEMSRWLRMHLGWGVFEGDTILSKKTIKEMQSPQTVVPIDSLTEVTFPTTHFSAYGLGFRLLDYHGRKIVRHGGAINGYRSEVVIVPEENLGLIVLSNRSRNTLVNALTYRIMDSFFGVPARDWSSIYKERADSSKARAKAREKKKEDERIRGTSPSHKPDGYAGKYTNEMFGEMKISVEGGSPVIRYRKAFVGDLRHWHHDTFQIIWRNELFGKTYCTFSLDSDGKVKDCNVEDLARFEIVKN